MSEGKEAPSGDDLLVRVCDYFDRQAFLVDRENEGLEAIFEDFVAHNCDAFEQAGAEESSGQGHSHHLLALHQKYLELFETTCERVIEVEGGSADAFYDAARRALRGEVPAVLEEAGRKWFLDAMMAAMNFEQFLEVMVRAARKKGVKKK